MDEIYFTDKGHTKKLNIPNIWPSAGNVGVPKEFFANKRLVLLIDPVLMNRAYFQATFSVYDAERVEYMKLDNVRYMLYGSVFMGATMHKGSLSIHVHTPSRENLLEIDAAELQRYWAIRDAGMKLIMRGVEEFKRLFPVQTTTQQPIH